MRDCPDPDGCPVVDYRSLAAAPRHILRAGSIWARCYDGTWGYDEPNPGYGDTRFAPFPDPSGSAVPTMYLAENVAGALLETIFHDTLPGGTIYEATLRGQLLSFLSPPVDLLLVDLRDEALAALAVPRSAIASSPSEHYPCTREIAEAFHHADPAVAGLIWHSRQAEFHRSHGRAVPQSQVAVVFTNRVGGRRGGWPRHDPRTVSLGSGEGRTMVDEIADALNVTTITG